MILNYFLQYWNEILSILGFVITLFTFIATLNVRSQVVHLHEKRNFQANHANITGKLEGFIISLVDDNLNTESFFNQIDLYMVDLLSKYTFFNIFIKFKCKLISHKTRQVQSGQEIDNSLARQLTELKNLISKEVII
ncbi:MAG: hypothetical protein LBQ71_12325 [Hungatella sp.]|jgi:hypothetical protein|nr:hypothetical protein [Hungatella sp.]